MSKRTVKIVRAPRFPFKTGVPCNVKVQGQRTLLKGVVLEPKDSHTVRVLTGHRGRPAHLPVESIEKVRVL